jgi:hypothetical protein
MRLKRMLLGAAALASLAALAAAGDNFNIDGVYQPTYVCFDGQGRSIVAEKAGIVKIFDGYFGTGGRVLLDIQNLVANYGGSLTHRCFETRSAGAEARCLNRDLVLAASRV